MTKRLTSLLAAALLLFCAAGLAESVPAALIPESADAAVCPESADLLKDNADTELPAAVENDCGTYRVIVLDAEGKPVKGAMIQLCDDTACSLGKTDEEGVAVFSVAEQKAYDIHVLKTPEGYAPDTAIYATLTVWSDVTIVLEKLV